MNRIKEALTRKFGPFPAWVYAIAFGAAAYWWRSRQQKKQVVLDPATQPGVMDSQVPQDVVTLNPGQSAYNPNTGQLIGTAPEQAQPPDRPLPVTLEPGETGYDPATGLTFGDEPETAPPAAAGKPTGKRKATKKPHHSSKRKPAKHGKKTKTRSKAHLPKGSRRATHPTKPAPKGRTRSPHPAAHRPAPRQPVAHRPAPKPVVRQHSQPVRYSPPPRSRKGR